MFKIKGQLIQLGVEVDRFTKTLDEGMSTQIRQAARAWLRAVVLKIPVYTGAARGTLRPLGRFLRVQIPIRKSPKARNRKMIRARPSTYRFTSTKKHRYNFSFNNHLFYITLNNYLDMSGHIPLIHKTPWEAFEAGEKAFNDYMTDVAPGRLPKVSKYVTKGKIVIRGG